MTRKEYLLKIKEHLRNHKKEWFNSLDIVDGKTVGLKFYGRSIQRLTVNGVDFGGMWDIPTQKAFLAEIEKALDY